MNLEMLKERLERGENLHTEFKIWPVHPDDLASSIVAFANTDGGQIILGVDDKGGIMGIDEDELDRAAQFVDNLSFNNCEPPVTVVQETIRDEMGRIVLVVNVPKLKVHKKAGITCCLKNLIGINGNKPARIDVTNGISASKLEWARILGRIVTNEAAAFR